MPRPLRHGNYAFVKVNARRLRCAREGAKLSRAQLSERIELSIPSIWRIEKGQQVPGANILGAWAEACGVTVGSLFGDDPEDAETEAA